MIDEINRNGWRIKRVSWDAQNQNTIYYFEEGNYVLWARSHDDDYYFVFRGGMLVAEGHLLAQPGSENWVSEALHEVSEEDLSMVKEANALYCTGELGNDIGSLLTHRRMEQAEEFKTKWEKFGIPAPAPCHPSRRKEKKISHNKENISLNVEYRKTDFGFVLIHPEEHGYHIEFFGQTGIGRFDLFESAVGVLDDPAVLIRDVVDKTTAEVGVFRLVRKQFP